MIKISLILLFILALYIACLFWACISAKVIEEDEQGGNDRSDMDKVQPGSMESGHNEEVTGKQDVPTKGT